MNVTWFHHLIGSIANGTGNGTVADRKWAGKETWKFSGK